MTNEEIAREEQKAFDLGRSQAEGLLFVLRPLIEKLLATPSQETKLDDLRDYFAAAALQGDWASQNAQNGEFANDIADIYLEVRAALYYRMANIMLKAKGNK